MANLELKLLGQPKIFLDGESHWIQRNKGRALLFYLAVTAREHSRQTLAGLLWEMPENRARGNLSVELGDLNKRLPGVLSIQGRQTIAINNGGTSVDVANFKNCFASETPTLNDLESAVTLYKGPFLSGFSLKNAPLFEQWTLTQQAQLEPMAFRAFYALAAHYGSHRQYQKAISYLDRLLSLEPLIEEAHRQKMTLLTLNDQRTEALAQYETCRAIFAQDDDEPDPETTALYHQILEGQINEKSLPVPVERSPVIAIPPKVVQPFQAPVQTPYFTGRKDQIVSFKKKLTSPAQTMKIYSLVGMGGVGKTALAIQLANELRQAFPDGVLWANIAASDPINILESWATGLGYDFTSLSDLESRAAAWRGIAEQKKLLIILDNVDSPTQVRPLLPNTPHCAVLLTTRDLDLALVLNTKVTQLDELSPAAGRQLLSRILGARRVTAELEAAAAICSLVDHLPLAIEIIAQRLQSRPQRKLADTANRLRTIENRLADLEISDRAVRSSFQISWETLDGQHQRIFSLLAVFNGRSFTHDALAAVAGLDPYPAEDHLFNLAALSLVKEAAGGRYEQHPLLAHFSAEKLGPTPAPFIMMARYYQRFAEQHANDYDALRPEWDNLAAAQEKAFQHEQWPLIINYATALSGAWLARGRYSEARQGNQLAYQAASKVKDPKSKAQFLFRWAHALVEQNAYEEARQLLLENLEQYQALSDSAGTANVYYELGRIAHEQSRHQEARQYYLQSQEIRQAIGDIIGLAESIEGQARLFYRLQDYQEALTYSHEALSHYENAAYKLGIVETLRTLANTYIEMFKNGNGDLDLAGSHAERAIHLAREMQDKGELAVSLFVLSRVQTFKHDFQPAEDTGRQSLELLEKIGHQRSLAIVLRHLGEIKYHQEQYEAALEPTNQSLPIFHKIGADYEEAISLINIGIYHDRLGRLPEAREYWRQALEIAQKIQNTNLIANIENKLIHGSAVKEKA